MPVIEVAHQDRALGCLRRTCRQKRLAHAYLFHGPDGVGKETAARSIAQQLECTSGHESACGGCQDCLHVAAGTHPDVHLIHRHLAQEHPDVLVRKRKALDIGVDVLRHFVVETIGLKPTIGRWKVFIIRDAERMTVSAQNALLKTLEEPPGDAMIVLLTSAASPLLPTVRSRCQGVEFDALPRDYVLRRLRQVDPSLTDPQAMWYAEVSEGSLGTALRLAGDRTLEVNDRLISVLSSGLFPRDARLDEAWGECAKGLAERFRERDDALSDTDAQRQANERLLALTARWFGDLVRRSVDPNSDCVNVAQVDQLRRQASTAPFGRWAAAIDRLALALRHLEQNAHPGLVLETMFNDLASLVGSGPSRAGSDR